MKYGFSLIELMVSTLIASMIGSLLLTALYQSSRVQNSVDTMFDTSLRVGIITNQLERDLMGAFVPTQARIKDAKEEEGSEKKDGKVDAGKKSSEKKEDKQEEKKEKISKPAEKPLEKIFYSVNKGVNLDTLTFITNNPLSVFVGKDVGVVKPKLVRVQYVLKPDEENSERKKDTFTLFRQEGIELDVAKFGSTRSYEVINGIKEFAVTYTAKIEKKEENSQAAPVKEGAEKKDVKQLGQKPKVYEYKTSKDWVSERKQEENKTGQGEEQEFPRVPYMVEIKMVLWNKQHSKNEEFTLVFELPVDTSPVEEKEEKDDKAPKKDEKKDSSDKSSEKTPNSSVDKNKQAHSDKAELMESLTVTLGNLTKALGTL